MEFKLRVYKGEGYPQTPQHGILRHSFDGYAVALTEVVTVWRLTAGSKVLKNHCNSDAFESHPLRQFCPALSGGHVRA
jgi:hypothetical protein